MNCKAIGGANYEPTVSGAKAELYGVLCNYAQKF